MNLTEKKMKKSSRPLKHCPFHPFEKC
jgi:hypothetical protein